jgi:hypothetical protein
MAKAKAKVEETVVDSQITDSVTQAPEMSELDKLYAERTGNVTIQVSPSDLKYLKNILTQKVEWKGSNEAYLYLMANLYLTQALEERDHRSAERFSAEMPVSVLESINFFLGRVTGKGEESAHRLFAVSMLLRPAVEKIKELDQQIQKLTA